MDDLSWRFYEIEESERLLQMLIIHIISKKYNSTNIILLCAIHDLTIRVNKHSKASCKIKQSANDWGSSLKDKTY